MEISLTGNSLRTFTRSINCLARLATDLIIQASPSTNLQLHTLNASRSAYLTVSLSPHFFDVYSFFDSTASTSVQCSVLLKSLCAILRTSASAVDRLAALLPSADANKIQWTLYCVNGVKKTYWITCNVEPDIQQLSLDRRRFPSSLVVRPRDLSRILANFQSSLQEITLIATEPSAVPSDAGEEIGGKAVELRSYIDHTKDNSDSTLHTQLWIDPSEEFLQYKHVGDPVDITFGVKELKAFLTFCEGCEVDIHLYFEKAGEPILMAPVFGFDDGSHSDYDATLVLATMLVSQLSDGNNTQQPSIHQEVHAENERNPNTPQVTQHPSDHTKIWSDLSGSAAKSTDALTRNQVHNEGNTSLDTQNDFLRHNLASSPREPPQEEVAEDIPQPMETQHPNGIQDGAEDNPFSQHHPSNWVGAVDDDEDEEELYVQPTPQYDV